MLKSHNDPYINVGGIRYLLMEGRRSKTPFPPRKSVALYGLCNAETQIDFWSFRSVNNKPQQHLKYSNGCCNNLGNWNHFPAGDFLCPTLQIFTSSSQIKRYSDRRTWKERSTHLYLCWKVGSWNLRRTTKFPPKTKEGIALPLRKRFEEPQRSQKLFDKCC